MSDQEDAEISWARWAYLPGYFIDIPFLRSGIWTVSVIGLAMLFIGVAF